MTSSMLTGKTVARADLNDGDVRQMFELFAEHYQGTYDVFRRDLNAKDWVVLLQDEAGCVQGFSTLAVYPSVTGAGNVMVVYSGDTIIRPAFWGTPELPRTWVKTVLRLAEGTEWPLYWLLISSGYKTYRFLPVFFREYYPCYDKSTPPDIKALMDHLAGERFGADYDAQRGIVRFREGATPLRNGVADLTPERLLDPHVAFFVACNPGHAQGDELVCLARVHPDNFTAAGRRMAR
jgi:hypothetical protein